MEAMGKPHTKMEEKLAAITASLNEARVLLASCARKFGVKEQEGQEASKGSVAIMSGSLFALDLALEQPDTKSSSPSFISTHRVVAAGVPHADAVSTAAMPTRCSTLDSDIYDSSNHAAGAIPSLGKIEAALLAPLGPLLDKPLQSCINLKSNTALGSRQAISGIDHASMALTTGVISVSVTDPSETLPIPTVQVFVVHDLEKPTFTMCSAKFLDDNASRAMDIVSLSVTGTTNVSCVFAYYKPTTLSPVVPMCDDTVDTAAYVWSEELLQHDGVEWKPWPPELQVWVSHKKPICRPWPWPSFACNLLEGVQMTLVRLPWRRPYWVLPTETLGMLKCHCTEVRNLLDRWWSQFSSKEQWPLHDVDLAISFVHVHHLAVRRLSGFSPGNCEHQHDLHWDIVQQLRGISRLWDPGISTAQVNLIYPGMFEVKDDSLVLTRVLIWDISSSSLCYKTHLSLVFLSTKFMQDAPMCFLLSTMEGKQAWAVQCTNTLSFSGILQAKQACYRPCQIIHGFFSTLVRQPKRDVTECCMVTLKIQFLFRALIRVLMNEKYSQFKQAIHGNVQRLECELKIILPSTQPWHPSCQHYFFATAQPSENLSCYYHAKMISPAIYVLLQYPFQFRASTGCTCSFSPGSGFCSRNQGDTARAAIRRFAFKGIASDVAEYSIKMGIRSGIQDFCSVASSANKLQYKQWNPGILEAPPWQDEYSVLSKNMWKFTLKDLYSYHSSNQFIDKSWKKIGKSSRVVGAQQCCNLSDPLLGGKQCFLGAVMSCPCIMELWA